MKSWILLAIIVLIALLVSVGHSQVPDPCPAYLELGKGMIAERDIMIEIQKRQIAALQAKIAEKEKTDAPKEGK